MGRKKNKGGGRKGGFDDDHDADGEPKQQQQQPKQQEDDGQGGKQLTRKQKRQQKQKAKQQQHHQDDDDDDGDDLAALLLGGGGGGAKNKYGSDDDDDEPTPPPPSPTRKQNKKKKGGRMAALVMDDSESEKDSDKEDEDDEGSDTLNDDDDDDDDGEVEQIAFVLADDDGWGTGTSSSKKKHKKEKKEKKHKKEKKKHKKEKKDKHDKDSSGSEKDDEDDYGAAAAEEGEKKKKSKFELQMEAAMSKKKEEEEGGDGDEEHEADDTKKKKKKPDSAAKKGGMMKAAPAEDEPDWVDNNTTGAAEADDKDEDDHDHGDIVYGAPDDVAWTDKSHAQKSADAEGGNHDDGKDSMLYGPDGKKLSNKERKKLLKAKQAAEREAEYMKTAAVASREGAQFACSQTAINENDPQWENSLDITIPSFNISAAGKILFKDASLTIGHGRRYGLVGANGRGKSTLLKMIASRDLKLPPRIDFLYVEQEVVADDTPAVEAVLKADKRRWELLEEEQSLMEAVDNGDESETTIDRLQQVVDELTAMNADAAEAKARRILYGLGFTMDMQTKPTKMFSGGWRMRISLARALFIEPTLLMLDEPTNHLDLNAVIWLDEYLQKWKKTLFVVSHDQDFLNSVCQEILHIEDLKLISYKGNYDSFKKAEHTKFLQQVKAYEKQEKRLRELKKQGQSRAKATETMKTQNKQREAGARNQKKKNQAVATGQESQEAQELIKRPREYHVKLEFVEVAELNRPVMSVENVHFRYSPKHPIIFERIDFGIDMDSRICIVGPNGAGKSTLLKLLTGELQPTKGEVKRNPRLRMGIYNQHFVDRLPMGKTPVQYLRDQFQDETYQSVRNRLGKYGLEGHAHEVAMRDLSGGQKARVVFVELSLQEPHILLLDEPTNNLDIETIDALCDAINAFNGGIVVVTHDQRLIEECDCTLWVVEKQGVTQWVEGFDDYKETILRELEEQVEREASIRREKLEAAAVARAEKLAKLTTKVKGKKK